MTADLTHATITPNGDSEKAIVVLFNPNKYGLDKSNQIAEIAIPGLGSPLLQFVRGNTTTVTMELFFDTFEQQSDVRAYTDQIYGLLAIDPETHKPPVCNFAWGQGLSFQGILERVSGQFTLFWPDGTPAQATLNVTFKQFVDIAVEVRAHPTHSVDHTKTHIIQQGETLSSIAAQEYANPAQWRPIAAANNISNPRKLAIGQALTIPRLQ